MGDQKLNIDIRDQIVRIAAESEGSRDPYQFWCTVLPTIAEARAATDAKLSWCGAFCLSVLKQSGLAKDAYWKFGKGFIGPLGLKQTAHPLPGDIVYIDAPYQHHAIFVEQVGDIVTSVDGNQGPHNGGYPDHINVRINRRPVNGITAIYSIEALLNLV